MKKEALLGVLFFISVAKINPSVIFNFYGDVIPIPLDKIKTMNTKSLKSISTVALIVGLFCFLFFTGDKNGETFFYTMLISFMYSFVLGIGNGLLNNFLNKTFSWIDKTKQRAIFGVIGTVILNFILVYVCNYLNFIVIQGEDASHFLNGEMNFRHWFFINISLLISAFLHAKGFMREWKRVSNYKIVEQKLIAKAADARFESLKNQLDPHFLFNSLNVLDALIEENPRQAQKFTTGLSKIYRYVLEQKDKELVTVEEELNFAKTYCELLKIRFEESVTFEFKVSKEDESKFIIPLSLQLLLENAIKHNYATSKRPLVIRITSENGKINIENNLQKRENIVAEREGIGLLNIVQRYALLTEESNVSIESNDDVFRVKLPLLNQKYIHMKPQELSNDAMAYQRAANRVKELQRFYGNLISYCLVIPFLAIINFINTPNQLWFYFPALGWGIGLISHAIQVFGVAKGWQERKIKELMDKEKQQQS